MGCAKSVSSMPLKLQSVQPKICFACTVLAMAKTGANKHPAQFQCQTQYLANSDQDSDTYIQIHTYISTAI